MGHQTVSGGGTSYGKALMAILSSLDLLEAAARDLVNRDGSALIYCIPLPRDLLDTRRKERE